MPLPLSLAVRSPSRHRQDTMRDPEQITWLRDEADRLERDLGWNLVSDHLRDRAQLIENTFLGRLAMSHCLASFVR